MQFPRYTEATSCMLHTYSKYVIQYKEYNVLIWFQVHPDANNELYFTYSVEWKESAVSWASRWDTYLNMSDVQIHWFSIINSLVVVFFLSGILTMIMIRTLRRDIARYNTDDNYEDTLEETGWKLVHGDVFRPPKHPRLFAAVVGSGIQIFFMALITICKFRSKWKRFAVEIISMFMLTLQSLRCWECFHRRHVVR